MKKLYCIILAIAITHLSCSKFLDVTPKGILIPEKFSDYEGLLNAPSMTQTFPINLLHFTDDHYNIAEHGDPSSTANGYFWRPIITTNQQVAPDVWGPLYRCIYSANVIINGVKGTPDASDAQKQSVYAEALMVRANCYMDLLTVFAKAYQPETAVSDPGLPLVTSTDVNDKVPARSTVQATLEAIIADVTAAADNLPSNNVNRYRATKYAAFGLLSRIYLYMADYEKAQQYTDMALQASHSLLNYNSFATRDNVPVYDLNPEILWQRSAVAGSPNQMIYSADLKSYFSDSDIRYQFLTVNLPTLGIARTKFLGEYNFGITFPEMYMTRAELFAREGKVNEAVAVVNMLRRNRIRTASYVDQSAASAVEALNLVFAERRRELAYSGLRWFDMKRLDREGRMPEVRRTDATGQVVFATLPPHSPKYTFEIPIRVSAFNPEMELNHK